MPINDANQSPRQCHAPGCTEEFDIQIGSERRCFTHLFCRQRSRPAFEAMIGPKSHRLAIYRDEGNMAPFVLPPTAII